MVHLHSIGLSLLGVLVGGGSIYLMGMLGDFLFKKESMGGGDVKLMAMVGAFMGWKMAILAFFIAPFFGAIYGIVEKIRTKDTAIAYGPFLVLGSIICKGIPVKAYPTSFRAPIVPPFRDDIERNLSCCRYPSNAYVLS